MTDAQPADHSADAEVPYTDPCPKCDGRGFTRDYIEGQRESDKCGWCHGGGIVPRPAAARFDPNGNLAGVVAMHIAPKRAAPTEGVE